MDFHFEWIRFVGAVLVFIYMIFDLAFVVEHVHSDLTFGTYHESFKATLSLGIFGYCFDIPKRNCYHGFLSQLVSNHSIS